MLLLPVVHVHLIVLVGLGVIRRFLREHVYHVVRGLRGLVRYHRSRDVVIVRYVDCSLLVIQKLIVIPLQTEIAIILITTGPLGSA